MLTLVVEKLTNLESLSGMN